MKIAWISDFKSYGGGEDSQNILLKNKPDDLDIDLIYGGNLTKDYDLYVVNSFRTLSRLQMQFLMTQEYIVAWRDIIDTVHDNLLYDFYLNAKMNIFLSPLHKDEFVKKFNIIDASIVTNKWICIAPYFDISQHESLHKRPHDILWCGDIQNHKGIEEVLVWAREHNKVIDFYGKGHPTIIGQLEESKYANYMGHVDKIKYIYPQYKNFIHFSDKIETFGRSCMEAYLSGCNMIVNKEKIGMYSYDRFPGGNMQKWFDEHLERFWKIVKM